MALTEASFADVNNNVAIDRAEIIERIPSIVADYIESIEIDWQNKRNEWLEWKKTNNRSRSIYAHLSFIEYLRETGDRKKINKQVPLNLPQVDESSSIEDLKEGSSNEDLKEGSSNGDLKEGSSTEEIRTKQNGLDDFNTKQQHEARTTGYLEKYLKNKSQPSIGKGTCGKADTTNVQSRAKSPIESKLKTFRSTEVGATKPASQPKKNVTPFTNSSSAQRKNVIPAAANQNKEDSCYSRCSMGSQVQSRKSQQTPGYKTSNSSGTAAKPKKSLIPTKCSARSAPVKVTSVDTTGQGKGIRGTKKVATGSTAMGSEAQSKSKIPVTPREKSPHLNPQDKQEIGLELNAIGISEQEPPTFLNVSLESCALANPGDTNDPTGDKKDSNDADAKDHTNSQKVSSMANNTSFTSETLPSPLRYQRKVTLKRYNYEETRSSQEESSYEVYVEKSNHVLKEMQEAIDSENSCKLDTSMRNFIKTFQDYEQSTSRNDTHKERTHDEASVYLPHAINNDISSRYIATSCSPTFND